MLRKPLRRALVLLGALPFALAAAPSAHAQTIPVCDRDVLRTAGVRVAVGTGDGRLSVCVDDVTAGGLVVSVSTVGRNATLPTVTRDVGSCQGAQVDLSSPVQLSVAAGAGSVCVGLNGLTTTVTSGDLGYDPAPRVWRTGTGALIDYAFCVDEYVAWLLSVEPSYDPWTECANTPERIA